jgi:hypothetical protein
LFKYISIIMIIKKLLVILITYCISSYVIIDKIHYDINHYAIEYFKEERYRCIRYIHNNHMKKKDNIIVKYITKYPYAKCRKYKNEYIEYIIYKNNVIIYNTLIHIIFYINIIFL